MTDTAARRLHLIGRVQGVGFRPFVYRLARACGLVGWVRNDAGTVTVWVQGEATALADFTRRVVSDAPPLARPRIGEIEAVDPITSLTGFAIQGSTELGEREAHVPPDYFACPDCLRELHDPGNRRYRYPFINCTQCGPRYTLISGLPYDRVRTTMAGFALCPECAAEYGDPADRRFHAEPVACPVCGPQLHFHRAGAVGSPVGEAALAAARTVLEGQGVVAVKGIGGYHLLCDAGSATAVERLRARKRRPDKPLAVLFPDDDAVLRGELRLEPAEYEALHGPERPIVLVPWAPSRALTDGVAPGLTEVGVMLPYSPLHELLVTDFGRPLVATSGNRSGEPVLTDGAAAETGLEAIADGFLHHDRPILRPADDSVCRIIGGHPRWLRAGRGLAPLELPAPWPLTEPHVAVGGHMKNTIALGWGARIVLSPHIGDLDSPRALDVFAQVAADLPALYGITPTVWVADRHPDYASRRWVEDRCGGDGASARLRLVDHHAAHAGLVAASRPELTRWLVFTWDGVGLGPDDTLWGGEALVGWPGHWRRRASFRPFRLPGAPSAGREPWRSAAALSWASGRPWTAPVADPVLARTGWERGLNTASTTAVGRLFDAAACLAGLAGTASYEGQGPMTLEACAAPPAVAEPWPLQADAAGVWRADWAPMLHYIGDGQQPVAVRAGRVHDELAATLVAQVERIAAEEPIEAIGLSGGVFQNRRLAEPAIEALESQGWSVYLPTEVPYNDGGLAYGQIIEAGAAGGDSRVL